jgi:Fe2+ or Zn2+ uptake regulation protein
VDKKLRQSIEGRMRAAGMRVTPQRFAVLEYLAGTHEHPTAEQIGVAVNSRFPTASRASVYNVLHALRDAGMVHEIYLDDAVARYDANLAPHHHFICRACGLLDDVEWQIAPNPPSAIGGGRVVDSYEVILRGLCADCGRAASSAGPG